MEEFPMPLLALVSSRQVVAVFVPGSDPRGDRPGRTRGILENRVARWSLRIGMRSGRSRSGVSVLLGLGG